MKRETISIVLLLIIGMMLLAGCGNNAAQPAAGTEQTKDVTGAPAEPEEPGDDDPGEEEEPEEEDLTDMYSTYKLLSPSILLVTVATETDAESPNRPQTGRKVQSPAVGSIPMNPGTEGKSPLPDSVTPRRTGSATSADGSSRRTAWPRPPAPPAGRSTAHAAGSARCAR